MTFVKKLPWIAVLLPVLAALLWLSLTVGSYDLTQSQVAGALWPTGDSDLAARTIVWQLRMPRTLLALAAGGVLALAGTVMQGLFRNPLVEPGLAGVSSGAALGAVLVLVGGNALAILPAGWEGYALPLAAFCGALGVTALSFRLSRLTRGLHTARLLLTGIAINAMSGALIGLLLFGAPDSAIRNFTFWSLGSLGAATWAKLGLAIPLLLAVAAVLLQQAKPLNALTLGENEARHLGINVSRIRRLIIYSTALAVGASVAVCGIIGFVGLVVPHVGRLVVGLNHRRLLPFCCLAGGVLLLAADILTRVLVPPAELPIGILTSLIGAPYFLYLLYKIK